MQVKNAKAFQPQEGYDFESFFEEPAVEIEGDGKKKEEVNEEAEEETKIIEITEKN